MPETAAPEAVAQPGPATTAESPDRVPRRRACDQRLDEVKRLLNAAGVDPFVACNIIFSVIDYGTARADRGIHAMGVAWQRSIDRRLS